MHLIYPQKFIQNKQQMSKTSNNKEILRTVTEETKQKAPLYPYYPVSAKYQQNGDFFLFSVQYPNNIACISFFMIKKDQLTKKKGVTSIELAGINDRSAISIIQIIDFKFKENNSNVAPLEGTLLVGYREGHLVIVKFKDKRTEVVHKFNKLFKKQGFMSKASSFIGGQQVCYKTLIHGPIKTALYSPSKNYAISFLVKNTLIFYKNKEEMHQELIQKQYKFIEEESKSQDKTINVILPQGIIHKIHNTQICTYQYTEKEQIIVAYSMESIITCYSSKDWSALWSIKMTMPIRKMNFYNYPEGQLLSIMPYEDYIILVNLNKRVYTKLVGHRCFVANSTIYRNQTNSLVLLSGGMDHRICFDKIEDIKTWQNILNPKPQSLKGTLLEKQIKTNNIFQINQDQKDVQFSNKYSLGQYQNARTNSHDYGFSDLIAGNGLIAFPTYDGKIKVFAINYR